jgi:hypothetical protein
LQQFWTVGLYCRTAQLSWAASSAHLATGNRATALCFPLNTLRTITLNCSCNIWLCSADLPLSKLQSHTIQTITPFTCLLCYHQVLPLVIIYSTLLNNSLCYMFARLRTWKKNSSYRWGLTKRYRGMCIVNHSRSDFLTEVNGKSGFNPIGKGNLVYRWFQDK